MKSHMLVALSKEEVLRVWGKRWGEGGNVGGGAGMGVVRPKPESGMWGRRFWEVVRY